MELMREILKELVWPSKKKTMGGEDIIIFMLVVV